MSRVYKWARLNDAALKSEQTGPAGASGVRVLLFDLVQIE